MPETHSPTEKELSQQTIKVPGELVNTDTIPSGNDQERLPGLEYKIPLNPDSPLLTQYRDRIGFTQPPLEFFLRLSITPQEPGIQLIMQLPMSSFAIPLTELGVDPTSPTGVSIDFHADPAERITLTVPKHNVAPQLTPLQDFLKKAALSH